MHSLVAEEIDRENKMLPWPGSWGIGSDGLFCFVFGWAYGRSCRKIVIVLSHCDESVGVRHRPCARKGTDVMPPLNGLGDMV